MNNSSDNSSFPVGNLDPPRATSSPLPRPFLQGQVYLLKQLAQGTDSEEVLRGLVDLTERVLGDASGAAMRYHEESRLLTVLAAPSLPEEFRDAIDGIRPEPDAECFGNAVHSDQDVLTKDIEQEDSWAPSYRDLALAHGFRACWAVPLSAADDTRLGVLALYRSEPITPSTEEFHVLKEASHLASVVLERTHRKQRLRDTRARHLNFLENVPVGVYRTTPDGELLYANPALVDMLRAESLGELKQVNVRNWYVDQSERKAFKSDIAETGTVENREARIHRLDGKTIDIMESSRAVRDDAGQVQYYEGIFQEITERKRVQRILRDREEKLRAILENAQPIFFMIDQNGTILLAKGSDLEVFGLTSSKVVGTSIYDLLEDRPEVVEQIDAALSGETVSFTSEIGDRILDTWCTPYYNEEGEVTACIGMSTDITERREAQIELRETKNFYEQLLNQLPMELAVFDPDARFEYVNAQGVSDSDTREWLIGRTNEEYCRHHDLNVELGRERDEAIREVARTKEPTRVQESIRTEDGTRHYIRIHVPVTDLEGRVTNVVGCSLDVTERVRSEQELREAKEEAEEAAELKSAMLANMSHEIRTPLTSITGFAEILEDEGEDADIEHFASLIVKSGKRLLNTLDSVLQLSKLEAGGRSLNPRRVDLTDEVRTVVTEQRARSEADNIEVRAETPSEPVLGHCDPTAVQRILTNLVSNGIKFTEPGDEVIVRVSRADEQARLQVEDTGVGMSASFQEEMFEAFKQESTGLARQYEGSGLGLSLVKELVDRHDGTLEVESAPGEGTTMTVYLPLYDE